MAALGNFSRSFLATGSRLPASKATATGFSVGESGFSAAGEASFEDIVYANGGMLLRDLRMPDFRWEINRFCLLV